MHGFENGGFEEEGFNCGFWIVDCGLTLLFFVLVWPRQKQPRIAQINTDYFHHKRHKSNHEFTQINTNFSDTDLHCLFWFGRPASRLRVAASAGEVGGVGPSTSLRDYEGQARKRN